METNPANSYVRVGIKYFKIIKSTDIYGTLRETLLLWNKETLIDDYGKDVLKTIRRLDSFTNQPDNINYKRIINNQWNTYEPSPYRMIRKNEYNTPKVTLEFMKHIFGDKLDVGLRYLKVIWEDPKQKLPILALVSKERQTGKTTFINYLDLLFGGNMVILDPSALQSTFNSSYVTKNVIAIEETEFQSKRISEKLKALSTMSKVNVNTKNLPEYDIPFYGKIILASNNEDRFALVREDEIRYFVLRVGHIEKLNINILDDMKKEAPHFLRYLHDEVQVEYKTRMVFTPEEIKTEALEKVQKESMSNISKDITVILDDIGSSNPGEEFIYFSALDLKRDYALPVSVHYISRVVDKELGLSRAERPMKYTSMSKLGLTTVKDKRNMPFIYRNPHYDADYGTNVIPMRKHG